MKFHTRIKLLFFAITLVFNSFLIAQGETTKGIQFFHGTFAEALEKANKEGKLIFMDAYTSWCGPCKRMSASVFPDPVAGDFFNPTFINLKIDMEKEEGPTLSKRYNVQSYPTLLFLDGSGEIVHRASGARPVDGLIDLGKEALLKYDKSGDYAKLYNEGKRDHETVLAYIKSLNQAGRPSLKITNDYLLTQKDLTTPENLDIILNGATDADSKVFEYLIQNKDAIIKLKSKETFETRVYACCKKTATKALEYRNESLLKDAQSKMKHHPSREQEFKYDTDLQFYGQTGNAAKYLKSAKSYASKVAKKDPEKLSALITKNSLYFKNDKSIGALSEVCAKKAMKYGMATNYYVNYAAILSLNGKKQEALKIAKQALELAKAKKEPTQMIESYINQLTAQ